MNAFGKKVKEVRLVNKLSQQKLANMAGIEISQVGRIERGEVNASLSTMDVIAVALGVLPSELLRDIGR